jgi:hypothetical protein
MKKKEPEQEEPTAYEKACLIFERFKYIWLGCATIATYIMTAMVAHVMCVSMGLPTIVQEMRTGKCYFLDTSKLGSATASGRLLSSNTRQ